MKFYELRRNLYSSQKLRIHYVWSPFKPCYEGLEAFLDESLDDYDVRYVCSEKEDTLFISVYKYNNK